MKPTFRMSSAGACGKKLSAIILGESSSAPPPWLAQAAEEGNWHEERLKQELRALGCLVTKEQSELVLDYPEFTLIGHIDGAIVLSKEVLQSFNFNVSYIDTDFNASNKFKEYLLEVKTFSFLEHQRWIKGGFEAFPTYAAQSTCYASALNTDDIVYATKDRSGGARHLYLVKGMRSSMTELVLKLKEVVKYTSQGDLYPAEFDPNSIECRRCQFRSTLCSYSKLQIDNKQLEEAAALYLEGSSLKKLGAELTNTAKGKLIGFAQRKEVNQWSVGPYSVTYSSYPRESISIKNLTELMPREAFDAAIKVAEVDRIQVVNNAKED